MIDTILFDLDGVLVDATEIHYQALNQALKEVSNYTISRSDHDNTYNGLPTRVKLEELVKLGIVQKTETEAIYGLKQKYTMSKIRDLLEVDEDNIDMLIGFKRANYKLGCVTNAIGQTAIEMLKRTGQKPFFDLLVNNQDIPFPKPNPCPYLYAMAMLGSSPRKTLIIEDSTNGLRAAIASSSHVLHVGGPQDVTFDQINKFIENINAYNS